ncbi:MAG: hypothetical protein Q8R87_05975 [Anaerolineaceae bacterium]|nr:hypothetical protein [Anaerolineaceae bacterium]
MGRPWWGFPMNLGLCAAVGKGNSSWGLPMDLGLCAAVGWARHAVPLVS